MIKKGISGGLLSINSLIFENDRHALANNTMIKTSAVIREAAKLGLQSLYANADEVLDKYKDFDIIKEMKARNGANLLWVRARAIDADVVNTNGDYFSEEELTKEVDYQGKKMPAYKTFEGVPIYTNHKNDNIEEAKGMVVYAEWDDEEKCVYCVFFIDEDAYPDIGRGVRQGYIHDVSMGCSVDLGRCSICGNEATTERDYCECLKKYKGKMHPNGKRCFEYNFGIKFIELSCVGDGAFESCEIIELYDQEELLQKAEKTIKSAQALNSSITIAASLNEDISSQREIESVLRELQRLNHSFIRIAQTAGTLVGGQMMGGTGAQNATVVKILQGLGIDPGGSLNILDLVNLALNFLEVAVLNLFSRKDNIDLTHVAKLTKAMGELQNTLQDMIDDGIETAGHSGGQQIAPANPQQGGAQGQQPQQPQQQAQGAPQMQAQQALFEQPAVGQMVSPFSQQPYLMPLGGGVSASNENTRFVWASSNNEEIPTKTPKLNNFSKLAIALNNLREACGIPEKKYEGNSSKPQKDTIPVSSGDKNIMDHFKKIAQDLKKQNTVALAVDIKLDDQFGNKVVLSTDKGIQGYHKGRLTNWTPNLTDAQIAQMEGGDGYRVAADLLKDFSSLVKTAQKSETIDALIVLEKSLEDEREDELVRVVTEVNDHQHKTDGEETLQTKLDNRRKGKEHEETYSTLIGEKQTDKLVRIVTELHKDAKKAVGDKTLEEMLHPNMGSSSVSGRDIMCNLMNGVVKTCSASKKSPEEVLSFLTKSASDENFGKILRLARLGTSSREYDVIMKKMAQVPMPEEANSMPEPEEEPMAEIEAPMEEQAIKDIADEADAETTEGEIISALNVIKDNFEQAVEKLSELLGKMEPEKEPTKEDDMKGVFEEDEEEDLDKDTMKGAVTGLSLAGEDMDASPEEMVDAVNDMPVDQMAEDIDIARLPAKAVARAKSRQTRQASKRDIKENIIEWLADVANQANIPTQKIALAAKLFCSYEDAAKKVLAKSMRTAEVKVTDETSHVTTIYATVEDLDFDVKDAAFNQKFRDYAVSLLSRSGYEIDPTTFALTEISVDEHGMVCGKVSTIATKTFNPEVEIAEENEYIDEDREAVMVQPEVIEPQVDSPEPIPTEIINGPATMPEEGGVIMTASAEAMKKMARLKSLIKIAQGLGLPGAGAAAPAAPAAPAGDAGMDMGGMAGGAGDMGLGSLTGASPEMAGGEADAGINESPEPGNKAPWGTICPQCGSKDVDIANGEGTCNSCNANLKYKFIVEVAPPSEAGEATEEIMETAAEIPPAAPVGGIGGAEAGLAAGGMGAPAPAAPGMPPAGGMPAMANSKVMTRIAYQTSAEVYANALSDGFNKQTADKLPVGLVCPACGSRTASKKSKQTFCYDCNTISVSEIKNVEGEPGVIEANIVWIQ